MDELQTQYYGYSLAQLTLMDSFLYYQSLVPSSSATTSTGFQDDLVIGSIPPVPEGLTSLSPQAMLLYLSFYSHYWARNHLTGLSGFRTQS